MREVNLEPSPRNNRTCSAGSKKQHDGKKRLKSLFSSDQACTDEVVIALAESKAAR